MSVDIEPLLVKLSALAPNFGRAQDDLNAMVSRGRAQDYKGVMQNARLVLEALLRSLVTEELKQTPGKAMLDELVTKFRQQANAGIVPTNILAHMGTVQAWGNLSAHDHAGSLGDAGVKVGPDEVVASLNSMVAILSWYGEKKGHVTLSPTIISSTKLPLVPAAPAPTPAKANLFVGVGVGLAGAGVVLALAAGALLYFLNARPKSTATAKFMSFAALDAVYATRKEPVPPTACRKLDEADRLAKSAADLHGLSLIENPSAEAAYLLARVAFEDAKQRSPALDIALKCPDFAAAQHLAGAVAIVDGRMDDALRRFDTARMLAPTWLENRAKLAGVLLQLNKPVEAAKEIDALIAAAPDFAAGHLLKFSLLATQGAQDDAMTALCTAMKLGSTQAREKVEQLGTKCP